MARIVRFADTLSSHMALQQAPSRAAVYGTIDADMSWMHSLPEVDVKVVGDEPQGPCQHYCPDSQSLPHMRGSCSRPGCKGCSVCAATKSHAVLYSTKANVTRSARGQLRLGLEEPEARSTEVGQLDLVDCDQKTQPDMRDLSLATRVG